jgi:uncharacterized protein (TIGR02145 family)
MKLFNNGLLSGFQVPPSGPIDNCSNGTFNIGRGWVNYDFYNGKMDNLGMWNRALTQQEITNLYNAQFPTQTSLCLPTLTTNSPISTGIDSGIVGGNILNDGGSLIVLRGVCYSTTPNPNLGNMRTEDGSGVGSFTSILRNLSPTMTYYARSYAKNSNGVVVYGNEVSFTTTASLPGLRCLGTPTVTDIDGNVYNTVKIGNQCWTQSNLKVSRYRNGDNIPTGLSNNDWRDNTIGAYSVYENNPLNDDIYGKLYNHFAVLDPRNLCPTGWHIPSSAEWTVLSDFVWLNYGGGNYHASPLRSNILWNNNNNGTNQTGFTALPNGLRDGWGSFFDLGNVSTFWSSDFFNPQNGLPFLMYGNSISRGLLQRNRGLGLRCIKD